MTIENENALPPGTDQDVSITASGGDTGPLKITSIEEINDPDLIELRDAQAAVKAEEAADKSGAENATGAGQAQPQTPAPGPQAQTHAPAHAEAPHLIPKARFDEVNNGKAEAERQAAYWRGVAEARGQQGTAQAGQPGTAPPQQPSPADRLREIQGHADALATKFDNGEITMAEFKRQERTLNEAENAIREELLVARVKPAPQQPQAANQDELYLDTLTANLETQHPWVFVFDKVGTDAEWSYLKARALENLQERGVDPRNGNLGKYELRKEIAVLADELGPGMVANRAQQRGIALPGQQAPSQGGQQQQPNLSPQARARQAKLTMHEGAPPDLSTMTGTAGVGLAVTESQIEQMSDEEIAALPASTRQRLLGNSAP